MAIIKWPLALVLGVLLSGAEAVGIVALTCFMTGYWPPDGTFQICIALTSLAVYLYHKYWRKDSLF